MILAQQPGGGFNVFQSLQSAFTQLLNYLPQIIGALVVLLVGYVVARLIKAAITKVLQKLRVDSRLHEGPAGRYAERLSPRGSPSRLVGTLAFWVIMLFVIASAIGALQIPALTGFMNVVLGYLPRVVAALLILVVAAAIAGAVGGIAHRTMGDTATGRLVRVAVPTLVMAIAVFMVLTELQIAPTIVVITYAMLLGSLALGGALAFGLGGREAAADLINHGYQRAQREMGTVRQDLRTGRERARAEAQRYRTRGEGEHIPGQQRGEAERAESRTTPGSRPQGPDVQH